MNDDSAPKADLENTEKQSLENSETNREFEELLLEATKTKAEEQQEEKAEKSSSSKMSDAKAAEIVSRGLVGMVTLANQLGKLEIDIPEQTGQMVVSLFCPLVQKYGSKFQVSADGVDLGGWMPEAMALGGSALLGITVAPQMKRKPAKEVGGNGDQPQHG